MTTYLTAQCLEKVQARMARNLTDKAALFVEIHPGEVRLIAREDLAGLWDDPDLGRNVNRRILLCLPGRYRYLGVVILNHGPREVNDWFAFEKDLYHSVSCACFLGAPRILHGRSN